MLLCFALSLVFALGRWSVGEMYPITGYQPSSTCQMSTTQKDPEGPGQDSPDTTRSRSQRGAGDSLDLLALDFDNHGGGIASTVMLPGPPVRPFVVDASLVPVDISPPTQVMETLTRDQSGAHATRVTTFASMGNQLSAENELRAELAACREITRSEFAAQDAVAESYHRQVKVEAVAMLQLQQAESRRIEQEQAERFRELQRQGEAYQHSIAAQHAIANHVFEQKSEQTHVLQKQVLQAQVYIQQHQPAQLRERPCRTRSPRLACGWFHSPVRFSYARPRPARA